jgi:hypothetical protein
MSNNCIPVGQKVAFKKRFLYENVGTENLPEYELVGRKFFEETYISDDETVVEE